MQPSQSHKSKAARFTEQNLTGYLQGNKQQKLLIQNMEIKKNSSLQKNT